jgi:hypothetical protein
VRAGTGVEAVADGDGRHPLIGRDAEINRHALRGGPAPLTGGERTSVGRRARGPGARPCQRARRQHDEAAGQPPCRTAPRAIPSIQSPVPVVAQVCLEPCACRRDSVSAPEPADGRH